MSILRKISYSISGNYYVAVLFTLLKYQTITSSKLLEVKDAGKKGEGLYVKKSFTKGEPVFVATGPIRFAKFNEDDCYLYPDWYSIADGVWVDIQPPFVKVNHSCQPNLGIDGDRTFVALADIKKGEELSFDYSTTDDETAWKMTCFCMTPRCTGEIGDVRTMSQERFEHAYPFIPEHFIELYKKSD